MLVQLLYREASAVTWQLKLLSDGKVLRRQRRNARHVTARLDELICGQITQTINFLVKKLLRACSKLYAPKC